MNLVLAAESLLVYAAQILSALCSVCKWAVVWRLALLSSWAIFLLSNEGDGTCYLCMTLSADSLVKVGGPCHVPSGQVHGDHDGIRTCSILFAIFHTLLTLWLTCIICSLIHLFEKKSFAINGKVDIVQAEVTSLCHSMLTILWFTKGTTSCHLNSCLALTWAIASLCHWVISECCASILLDDKFTGRLVVTWLHWYCLLNLNTRLGSRQQHLYFVKHCVHKRGTPFASYLISQVSLVASGS